VLKAIPAQIVQFKAIPEIRETPAQVFKATLAQIAPLKATPATKATQEYRGILVQIAQFKVTLGQLAALA
jgi:hypothetical protein